ncbi:excinuclease ABC subunit UvrA [Gallicola sp. Sow4_E12]|uniref:excinuclease ABC subunit UvrA n=1 Tax=Gallicola sp. Sow4_E12 TaxID=3438785 RepID=UPI003F8F1E30
MSLDKIVIKGAKANNLKDIDLVLPRDKMIVFTGLSGSGKSSLAFDTIYAEGQRRYIESLSSYARQFLGQMDKPDVEYIEGLSPSISIDQKTTNRNPRSTVGTVTEIYDYFRLLYARVGVPYCPVCGKKIESQSVDQMVDRIMAYPERTKILLLAPVIKGKKGEHKRLLENIKKEGYTRIIVDGEQREITEEINLEKNKKHDIDIVIDRLIVKPGIESRLTGSLEMAIHLSEGTIKIQKEAGEIDVFNTKLACPDGHISYDEIEPRSFSFNNPFGMCPECNGLGFHKEIDPERVLPNYDLSVEQGGVDAYSTAKEGTYYYEIIRALGEKHHFSMDKPLAEAPPEFIQELLYGTGKEELKFVFNSHYSGRKTYTGTFEGIVENLTRRYRTGSDATHDRIEEYMAEIECPLCHGARLRQEYLAVRIKDKNIYEVTELSTYQCLKWFEQLELNHKNKQIAEEILKEIKERLQFLINVGLDYLTLSRMAATLSGGESQRIRLATQIGSALVGVVYVLDEPSIGLHQRDNEKLLDALRGLADIGNTLIVVEHDEDTMREADYIVDIGPGAGVHGGEIVAQGTMEDICKSERSITGQYLSGKMKIPVPKEHRAPSGWLKLKGCRENNLKNIDVDFPVGTFTCVTGVSGSGKSSLVNEILYKILSRKLNRSRLKAGKYDSIEGLEQLDKVVQIDQSPIGRSPRSNPATYTKVFDLIRDLYAQVPEAKMRGYSKGRFSFNVKGGRCEACKGDGTIKVQMHFLPDVYVPCEVCHGKRYNRETLQVKYKDKSIADVLDMTIEEGYHFFENMPSIRRKMETLLQVGLGYVKIGQPSTELSGGEAQRVKLATELSRRATGQTVYILDEPTTGLHTEDIRKLIEVLNQLVEQGNTIIVIEHNLDVIKTADYVIDLGPEGGHGGGEIIACGTPQEIAEVKKSYTGQFLKKIL